MSAHVFGAPPANGGVPTVLPADILHGIALRPPELAWDGVRYRGSRLLSARLAEAGALAGVVATTQRAQFIGVVAVTLLYARQAAAELAPVWQSADAGETTRMSTSGSEQIRYGLRLPSAEPQAGVRVTAWSVDGYAGVWLPACAPGVQHILRRELAALLQLPEAAIRLNSVDANGATAVHQNMPHPLDLMDAAADAALLSQAVGRPVCVACRAEAADELVLQAPQPAVAPEPASNDAWRREHSRSAREPVGGRILGHAPEPGALVEPARARARVRPSDGAQRFRRAGRYSGGASPARQRGRIECGASVCPGKPVA
jgi:nicotinate dehydrogenase subunit B